MKNKFQDAKSEIERLEKHYLNSDLKHIYLKHKEDIYTILNCVERIKKEKQIHSSDLKILEDGLKNSWEEVFYYQAGKFVSQFSFKYKEAEQLFYKLYDDKDYNVRFRLVTVLLNQPPRRIIKEILSKALHDRSLTVQKKAEDVIQRLNTEWKYNPFKKLNVEKLRSNISVK